jgi:hypothetical protein
MDGDCERRSYRIHGNNADHFGLPAVGQLSEELYEYQEGIIWAAT